jgi:glycine hydroxymethyltransferase
MVANSRALAHGLLEQGFRLVSGGTDNHLVLVDVNAAGLSGKVAEKALDHAGITVNRNGIPFDTRPPLDPSGIRIGSPALTTRGMNETQMAQIARWIGAILKAPADTAVQLKIRGEVDELCKAFPAPHEHA